MLHKPFTVMRGDYFKSEEGERDRNREGESEDKRGMAQIIRDKHTQVFHSKDIDNRTNNSGCRSVSLEKENRM